MNARVRSLLFEPLTRGTLRVLVPECTIHHGENPIIGCAAIDLSARGHFEAALHFSTPPPTCFEMKEGKTLGDKDLISITGLLEGEIHFEMKVLPTGSETQRSSGTSTVRVDANRIYLIPDTIDSLPINEVRALLGDTKLPEEETAKRFSAHLVFHGPTLHLKDSGTKVVRANDFLGDATSSSFDTHQFSGEGWEAGLIQKDEELHLHIRNQKGSDLRVEDPENLVDRITFAVAFTHGFQPWPVYKELRIDHRVVDRWMSTHVNLKQSWLVPISKRLGINAHVNKDAEILNIIPTIAEGFEQIPPEKFKKIKELLWHVLATDQGDLPPSTKLLMLCSALDGLIKVVVKDVYHTLKEWKAAAETTGLSWDDWFYPIMELRKKHRDHLSHGRIWLLMESGPEAYFRDYPRLGCAFMTVIAATCGYQGAIITDPLRQNSSIISQLKK